MRMPAERLALAALEDRLRRLGIEVARGEPMARHTSFRIGGPADLFVRTGRQDELVAAVQVATDEGVSYLVLGGGTNILCGDRGYRGIVIQNCCAAVEVEPWTEEAPSASIRAEAGVRLAALVRQTVSLGWGRLAWAEGIPGTVGGAIVGNAGAFGGSMADVTVEVELLDGQGERSVWSADRLEFGYRNSRLKGLREMTLLAARLRLPKQERAEQQRLMEEYASRRRQSQPGGASAGSVFRNPAGRFAGLLIEEAGLKGRRVGGAHISGKHANFIINGSRATAADVRALMELARGEVARRFGVELELEIELVGEF